MKSSELAKELGIKSSEIVAEVARLRGVSFKKRTTMVNLTADETEAIRVRISHGRQVPWGQDTLLAAETCGEDAETAEVFSALQAIPGVPAVDQLNVTDPELVYAVHAESAVLPATDMKPDLDVAMPICTPGMPCIDVHHEELATEAEASPEEDHGVDALAAVAVAETPFSGEKPADLSAAAPMGAALASLADVSDESTSELEPESAPAQFPTWHGDRHTLETRHLGKSYGKKTAVRNVSFSVQTGEIVGLLGPNGAGKTTTFYMVVGAIKPDHGEILLNGKDLRAMPMYQRALNGLGYLPQEPSIFRKLTVRENLKAVLEIRHKSERKKDDRLDIDEEVQGILEEFGLTEFADRDGYRLSGGERRRTEIARAVALRPTFLLFDEPFAGIDPIAIIELKKMIIYLKSKGLGILITDHNVRETLSITDRAYIIKDGTVFAAGDPEALVGNREVRAAYLGEDFRLS